MRDLLSFLRSEKMVIIENLDHIRGGTPEPIDPTDTPESDDWGECLNG